MRYSAFGETNIGKVRDHNEDAFFVSEAGGVFLVSDGMGGLSAGELASQITRETISGILQNEVSDNLSIEQLLRKSFVEANDKVRAFLKEHPKSKGMGCTCVTLVFKDNDFFIGYVGDSRIYLYRKGSLKQLTRDHSYVEELFLRGLITEEEKVDHPYKSSITRYVGAGEKVEVDISAGPVSNDDVFILCSDGLTGEVEDEKIAEILKENLPMKETVEKLIGKALENGGGDNVTVVAVKVEKKKQGFFKKLFSW